MSLLVFGSANVATLVVRALRYTELAPDRFKDFWR